MGLERKHWDLPGGDPVGMEDGQMGEAQENVDILWIISGGRKLRGGGEGWAEQSSESTVVQVESTVRVECREGSRVEQKRGIERAECIHKRSVYYNTVVYSEVILTQLDQMQSSVRWLEDEGERRPTRRGRGRKAKRGRWGILYDCLTGWKAGRMWLLP